MEQEPSHIRVLMLLDEQGRCGWLYSEGLHAVSWPEVQRYYWLMDGVYWDELEQAWRWPY